MTKSHTEYRKTFGYLDKSVGLTDMTFMTLLPPSGAAYVRLVEAATDDQRSLARAPESS